MSGSTYYVAQPVAMALAVLALLMLAACLLASRWLDLMPMGPAVATALGIRLSRAQLVILLLVAVLTASATMVIGPLSFARPAGALHGQADGASAGALAPARGGQLRRPADGAGGLGRPAGAVPAGGAGRPSLHPVRALTSCGACAGCSFQIEKCAMKARDHPGLFMPAAALLADAEVSFSPHAVDLQGSFEPHRRAWIYSWIKTKRVSW